MTTLNALAPSGHFQSSDLQRHRRDVLDAAHDGVVTVRDADGTILGVAPMRLIQGVQDLAALGLDLVNATALTARSADEPAALGGLAWLVHLDHEDRAECLAELTRELNIAASTLDLSGLHRCLKEWRATAITLSDPLSRSILLGQADDADMVEVSLDDLLEADTAG